MTSNTLKRALSLVVVGATSLALAVATADAAAPPVKLIPSSQLGRGVNLTEVNAKGGPSLEDVCTVESKDECQSGQESEEPGGFKFPEGVAGTASGNFYVADTGNGRVQELESNGKFVLMFGKEVDATTKGDICTAASKDACKVGVAGAAAGQFGSPQSVAVDPVSGDVYVAEYGTGGAPFQRVQKFTAGGKFLLEIGKEVNKTTKGNLCTQEEAKKGVECGGPAQTTRGSLEHGSFDFPGGLGNVLADGGEHDLLYVGEEGRVQEFEPGGQWKAEIPLTGTAEAVAVDAKANAYVVYEGQKVVHEFDSESKEVGSLEIPPRVANHEAYVAKIAIDSAGHIAVVANEERKEFGSLYEAATGLTTALKLPGFTIPEGVFVAGISFDGKGELYAAATERQEILTYIPRSVSEVLTVAATSGACKEEAERETSIVYNCQLKGEVNPYNIAKTEVWFEWGRTCALGTLTPKKEVETVAGLLPVSASIQDLRPKESFCYELAGDDQNVRPPEQLVGEPPASVSTPTVQARIAGVPSASFVKSSSAVMHGELNPENSTTEYFFEYAPELKAGEKTLASCPGIKEASCPGVASIPAGESALYGRLGTTVEASGLQPNTIYQYRLAASNEGGASHGSEGTFMTPSAPRVEAATGSFGEVTPTSALVSGTVNPDGQPARYMFELGVYQGATTHFGAVFSGPTGTAAEAKSLLLTGLQPGTMYAYRIAISSGYGTATGVTATFTTAGLPTALSVPSVLAQLPIPNIAFPKEPAKVVKCKRGYTRGKHNKCVKTKKKGKKAGRSSRHGKRARSKRR